VRALTSVVGNSQRLDGGAMFGNAPKAMWEKWISPDDKNRIPLACRCLLVRDGDRLILCEAGIGAFFDPTLRMRYGVVEDHHVLLASLAALGVAPEDVDVVILSHLHFDHAGGVLAAYAPDVAPRLVFTNATYVVGTEAWQRAIAPHARDRASFVPGLTDLLLASNKLELVTGETLPLLGAGYRFHRSNGHTPGLLLTEIAMPDGPVVFAADLIPDLLARHGRLFFTHDPSVALGRVHRDANGRFGVVDEAAAISELAT
jgi:glyoxylase-like metal-dependent hydrolase (beta-lactamase superfamily II)